VELPSGDRWRAGTPRGQPTTVQGSPNRSTPEERDGIIGKFPWRILGMISGHSQSPGHGQTATLLATPKERGLHLVPTV
jgi:hypothetical protein